MIFNNDFFFSPANKREIDVSSKLWPESSARQTPLVPVRGVT